MDRGREMSGGFFMGLRDNVFRDSKLAKIRLITFMKKLINLTIFSICLWGAQFGFGQENVVKKLNQVTFQHLEFVDTPLADALTLIQQKSVELDPEKSGVNIVILNPDVRSRTVTLKLQNASLGDVLRYTTMLAGARFNTTRFAVTISGANQPEKLLEGDTHVIEDKMRKIILESVDFSETPLVDALAFLMSKSEQLDPSGGGGVNIVYLADRETFGKEKITLRLLNIPLFETLKYTTQIANHNFVVEPNAILITNNPAPAPTIN